MQKIESKRNTLQIGSSIVTRGKGSKPLRKQGKKSQSFSPIVANGLYSLRLSSKLVCNQNKELEQLVPAYLRFVELFSIKPKDLNVLNPIKVMLDHINSIYAGTKMVDVIEDFNYDESDYFFLIRTVYFEPENYNIIIYKEVIQALNNYNIKYSQFFNCAINMLLAKGVEDWSMYFDYCFDYMEDLLMEIVSEEESDDSHQDELNNLNDLRNKYEFGEAKESITTIRSELVSYEQDSITIKNSLDPNHPIIQFYEDVFKIYQHKESLHNFVDQFQDDFNPTFSYSEQFCIVYELDELFYEWEESVNANANEGIGVPTSSTRISKEMDSIPVHNSEFPFLMEQLFNKYSDLPKQILDYGKNNRKAS